LIFCIEKLRIKIEKKENQEDNFKNLIAKFFRMTVWA